MSTIGQSIKEIRQEMHLSQEQFGRIFDSGKSYISSVENNKSKLSVDNLVKLLVNYNVSIDYILGGIGKPFFDKEETSNDEFEKKVLAILKKQNLI